MERIVPLEHSAHAWRLGGRGATDVGQRWPLPFVVLDRTVFDEAERRDDSLESLRCKRFDAPDNTAFLGASMMSFDLDGDGLPDSTVQYFGPPPNLASTITNYSTGTPLAIVRD